MRIDKNDAKRKNKLKRKKDVQKLLTLMETMTWDLKQETVVHATGEKMTIKEMQWFKDKIKVWKLEKLC